MGDNHAAEVQAELQQYLNSKNINSLFIQIVESLLIEKPANPIGFMVEYLMKQYPNETKDFQKKGAVTTGGLGNFKMPETTSQSFDNKVKSPETLKMLRSLIDSQPIISDLGDLKKNAIARDLEGPFNVEAGDVILTQGPVSEYMYLSETPVMEGARELQLFGEVSLLRNSSVVPGVNVGKKAAKYWRLSKKHFEDHVAGFLRERNKKRLAALSKAAILSTLSEGEMYLVAHNCVEERVRIDGPPKLLCRQGDLLPSMRVLQEGKVELYQVDAMGGEMLISVMGPGDPIAEGALISDKKANTTAKVITTAIVLRVDRAAIAKLMGRPLATLLKRNPTIYAKYVELDK